MSERAENKPTDIESADDALLNVPFVDLESATVRELFQGNLFSQIDITQRVLSGMLERGSGTIINMVSGSGLTDPPAPAGQGGWGFAYGASKAAFHRKLGNRNRNTTAGDVEHIELLAGEITEAHFEVTEVARRGRRKRPLDLDVEVIDAGVLEKRRHG